MFENPWRGRQARNFTTNIPKILDRKSSSEQILSENCRWVPLHRVPHDSSPRQKFYMKSRVQFKFPTPKAWDQIPHPLEDSDNQIPSSPGRQRCQMPGVCPGGGGMLKLRFDRYINAILLIDRVNHLVRQIGKTLAWVQTPLPSVKSEKGRLWFTVACRVRE